MSLAEWWIEGSLENLSFNLIQNDSWLCEEYPFPFLKCLSVSVVRCFRERFFSFWKSSLEPGNKSSKPVNKDVTIFIPGLFGFLLRVNLGLHCKWIVSRFKNLNYFMLLYAYFIFHVHIRDSVLENFAFRGFSLCRGHKD